MQLKQKFIDNNRFEIRPDIITREISKVTSKLQK